MPHGNFHSPVLNRILQHVLADIVAPKAVDVESLVVELDLRKLCGLGGLEAELRTKFRASGPCLNRVVGSRKSLG